MKKILTIICLISVSSILVAQNITPLNYNHAIKNYIESTKNLKSTAATYKMLATPLPGPDYYFFEDFSYYPKSVYPDPALWSDASAFVNQTYPDSCISIGVATLDGVDKNGNLYSTNDGPFPSDTLTSKDILLSGVTDSLYFSFFYQGGGKGDAPNDGDSLLVDFFNTDSSKWIPVWYTLGEKAHVFTQVIIPVADSFRRDNFKFRFRNWTTTNFRETPGGDESGVSNSDLWHIDYVQLKKADSIEIVKRIDDITMVNPLRSTHKFYHSVPYKHLGFSQGQRRSSSRVTIRTNFNDFQNNSITGFNIERVHETYNVYKGQNQIIAGEGPFFNGQTFDTVRNYNDDLTVGYNYNPQQEYGLFRYQTYLSTADTNQYKWNDTVSKIEVFKDYYAYDDGTAEFGFGLPGNGGVNMRLAYRYPLSITKDNPLDTLTAIDFHFVKTRNNASNLVEFKVCVWDNNDGEPGDLLYPPLTEEGELPDEFYTPDTTLGINEFMRIKLSEELVVNDIIYIGFVQTNIGSLSIGYDINSDSRSSIFTNDGNYWLQTSSSIPTGSIMMRPVFGNYEYLGLTKPKGNVRSESPFKVYPNPVRDYLRIETLIPGVNRNNYQVSVYNILGRMVLKNNTPTDFIDMTDMPEGLYLINISNLDTFENFTHKIIKSR